MGSPALGTLYPADSEPERSGREFHSPPVVAMYGEAGSVAAGTGQLMEWKVIKTVSYTHLDVYKRQGYKSIRIFAYFFAGYCAHGKLGGRTEGRAEEKR